jgi:rhodanese-related sulfurtransferase
MSFRSKFSIFILSLAIILIFLPKGKRLAGELSPDQLLSTSLSNENGTISPDEVARQIVAEDTLLRLIDLRSPAEFRVCNIPGAINIPFENLSDKEFASFLSNPFVHLVLYSNDAVLSNEAYVFLNRNGIQNVKILEGGLNEWFRLIMLSEFRGTNISPQENALFENRYKARRFFVRMNSLPDSLKSAFISNKKSEEKKLVGGCE